MTSSATKAATPAAAARHQECPFPQFSRYECAEHVVNRAASLRDDLDARLGQPLLKGPGDRATYERFDAEFAQTPHSVEGLQLSDAFLAPPNEAVAFGIQQEQTLRDVKDGGYSTGVRGHGNSHNCPITAQDVPDGKSAGRKKRKRPFFRGVRCITWHERGAGNLRNASLQALAHCRMQF